MSIVKLFVKLLIVAAVLNALARAGQVAWNYYQFKDAAQQAAVFGAKVPTSTLHAQVLRKAEELGIPIGPEQVVVTREGARTAIEAAYIQPVELFPRYVREVPLRFSVEGLDAASTVDAVR